MSIQGIGNPYGALGITPGAPRPGQGDRVQEETPRAPAAPADAGLRQSGVQAAGRSLPMEPPPGTDPALWSVLTSEERAFFARSHALGPLTYGPGSASSNSGNAPLRGGRIDLRV